MIQTERLKIYTVSDDEMKKLIAEETDDEMRTAYQEMLEGCISHPEQRNWYAVWFMELNGKRIGDLCFKGLGQMALWRSVTVLIRDLRVKGI